MNIYRIFLMRQGKIAAHHEFSAESDDWARRAADLAFDACTDYCDDFELWYGTHLVTSRAGFKSRPIVAKPGDAAAEDDSRAIAAIAARILEAATATSPALRDSPRLNARLNDLRRPPAGPG